MGSEMCIRDRGCSGHPSAPFWGHSPHPTSPPVYPHSTKKVSPLTSIKKPHSENAVGLNHVSGIRKRKTPKHRSLWGRFNALKENLGAYKPDHPTTDPRQQNRTTPVAKQMPRAYHSKALIYGAHNKHRRPRCSDAANKRKTQKHRSSPKRAASRKPFKNGELRCLRNVRCGSSSSY